MSAGVDSIDLQHLAARESEQVEWKENVADEMDVAETLAAFANDLQNLGGGYVVCGARESTDEHGFPCVEMSGLSAARLREVEKKVLALCRDRVSPAIAPRVIELPSKEDGKRILVFLQAASRQAHSARRRDGTTVTPVRISRDTKDARNGILRELLVQKSALEPWDHRACSGATVDDLDLILLRDAFARMRLDIDVQDLDALLTDKGRLSAFVPAFCARETFTGILRPRNFAVLLFGREPHRFIPGAVGFFSEYEGKDRSVSHARRVEIAGALIGQAKLYGELLERHAVTLFDKTGAASPNRRKYPPRALYEALGNALAHRDYERVEPLRITAFSDRIEFVSPGGLARGVDPDMLKQGRAGAHWRNQTLAWFFNRLQLGQAEGQGVPTILRTMKEEGCPPPTFAFGETQVSCVLEAREDYARSALLDGVDISRTSRKFLGVRASLESAFDADDEDAFVRILIENERNATSGPGGLAWRELKFEALGLMRQKYLSILAGRKISASETRRVRSILDLIAEVRGEDADEALLRGPS